MVICAQHDWWEAAPCPKCAGSAPATLEAETVTVAETAEDDLSIPEFLLRNKDGTFAHPELMVHDNAPITGPRVVASGVEDTLPVAHQSDAELYAALDDTELALIDRQPIYQELRAREDKKKSHARIAEMKARKEEKKEAAK